MTPSRPLPDLARLAAALRLAALALAVELAEWVGAGRLAAGLRRRMVRDLAEMERFATGILVLLALQRLPATPPARANARHPGAAPPGFRCAQRDANDMRAMRRKLFPRERDVRRRLDRFTAILDRLDPHARRLARHIERIAPAERLALAAPCADLLAPRAAACACAAFDTS